MMIEAARQFAIYHHGDQQYGDDPYLVHLENVVGVLIRFGYTDPNDIMSGYLHDTIEDTDATIDMIRELFGEVVVNIVHASTGIGANRKERTACILSNLKAFPRAAPVKAADRIANMASARLNKPRLYEMYQRELPEFLEVVRGSITQEMYDHLQSLG